MERRLRALQSKSTSERVLPICATTFLSAEIEMKIALVIFFFAYASGQRPPGEFETFPKGYNNLLSKHESIDNSELLLAFVIFRHGDRTPDQEELDLYPEQDNKKTLFPYGPKAVTNKGKQRAYEIGQYLRRRYDGFINRLYLPEESITWTTDFDRTKMTALVALAALFKPPPAQKWNPILDWQPVPYNSLPYHEDDLLYWYNCPRYLWLRDQVYETPVVKQKILASKSLFKFMSEKTGVSITTPEDMFFLSNLFQTLKNVGKPAPQWAIEIKDKIKEMTILEYDVEFYNSELIRLASGVLMGEIRNVTQQFVREGEVGPKLRLYSAHENNVAGLMAAVGAFEPHQPPYGATFSLELRRTREGSYGIAAVYTVDPTSEGKLIPIRGCGGKLICEFNTFMNLTQDTWWTKDDYKTQCANKSF